jgi:hypothetical protein
MPRLLLVPLLVACGTEADSADTAAAIDPLWADYEIAPPSAAINDWLVATPYVMPEAVCLPVDDLPDLDAGVQTTVSADGVESVCVWDHFNGNAPEGRDFTEFSDCTAVWTQGPGWFTPPARQYVSEDAVLDDPAHTEERTWARDQIAASGCACCHASGSGSGHTSGFDIDAPGVWTDSMTNAQLAMSAGWFEEHRLFAHFEATDNHGFDRTQTLWPTTDPARMEAFFAAEFARRGGDQADMDEAQGQFDALFGPVLEAPGACIDPYEGLVDGKLVWNGNGVRQLLLQEEGADNAAFPPNLHLPEGTVWAVYVDKDGALIESGTVAPGVVPAGATQLIPADGSPPELVPGRTYKLHVTTDIMSLAPARCTFPFPAEG